MRVTCWASLVLVYAVAATSQSLGDVARKEKKRRDKNRRSGASVRVITESDVRPAPPVVSRPETGLDGEVETASDHPMMTPGEPAPAFSLPDRSGRTVTLESFRGQPLLVDFWATWCGPCRQTMPEVERLHRKYRGRLQVVGINIEGKSPDVLSYLEDGGYTFPVLFDSGNWESTVAKTYGVHSIPRTFLMDREGRVLYEGHPNGLSEEHIQAAIAAR